MTTGHPELRNLTNKQIHEKLLECVHYERRVQNKILILIQEIQVRKIYLQKGYGSMLSYLITEMKYSESTALRRISAANILNLVPEAKEDLLNGSLNMTQLQKTALAIKEHERQREMKAESHLTEQSQLKGDISLPKKSQNQSEVEGIAEITKKALENIKNKNGRATDISLAQSLNIDSISPSRAKVTHHRDESVTLNIKLTAQQFEKLNEVKSILSHVIPSGNTAEILEYLCEIMIKKRGGSQTLGKNHKNLGEGNKDSSGDHENSVLDGKCQADASNSSNRDHEHAQRCTNGNFEQQNISQGLQQAKNSRRKNISQKTRKVVFEKARVSLSEADNMRLRKVNQVNSSGESGISLESIDKTNNSKIGCQYCDPTTGKICRSHHQLEVDHIQPVWAGGRDDADNLQILCRAHNQFKYQQQAGFYL